MRGCSNVDSSAGAGEKPKTPTVAASGPLIFGLGDQCARQPGHHPADMWQHRLDPSRISSWLSWLSCSSCSFLVVGWWWWPASGPDAGCGALPNAQCPLPCMTVQKCPFGGGGGGRCEEG